VNDEAAATTFLDVMMLALLGFVVMVVLMLPHLNPPTEGDDAAKPAGNIIVEARWPDELDVDVDLWVKAPGEKPVGYNNSRSRVFDLLRDDLGFEHDGTGLNFEFAFSRGAPDGNYAVNVHLYSNRIGVSPIPVIVVVSIRTGGTTRIVASRTVELRGAGHEVTVARFTLADGALVAGSVHDTPVGLRP
jgi:hypothetical protein